MAVEGRNPAKKICYFLKHDLQSTFRCFPNSQARQRCTRTLRTRWQRRTCQYKLYEADVRTSVSGRPLVPTPCKGAHSQSIRPRARYAANKTHVECNERMTTDMSLGIRGLELHGLRNGQHSMGRFWLGVVHVQEKDTGPLELYAILTYVETLGHY